MQWTFSGTAWSNRVPFTDAAGVEAAAAAGGRAGSDAYYYYRFSRRERPHLLLVDLRLVDLVTSKLDSE